MPSRRSAKLSAMASHRPGFQSRVPATRSESLLHLRSNFRVPSYRFRVRFSTRNPVGVRGTTSTLGFSDLFVEDFYTGFYVPGFVLYSSTQRETPRPFVARTRGSRRGPGWTYLTAGPPGPPLSQSYRIALTCDNTRRIMITISGQLLFDLRCLWGFLVMTPSPLHVCQADLGPAWLQPTSLRSAERSREGGEERCQGQQYRLCGRIQTTDCNSCWRPAH
jgi:hypothetical protein